ncbi:MAG: hypothetical protein A2Y87_12300 [Bacteroidetes bacterium RBG_13_46_8]|nr:MAG: hypothetical protein A2Y87_12300 [Bacteroidetes bacterium RBG_13_46_8]
MKINRFALQITNYYVFKRLLNIQKKKSHMGMSLLKSIFAYVFYPVKSNPMTNQLAWKNKLFSENCELFSPETRVGEFRKKYHE